METLPKISVVTVCLNAAPMLEKTLASVEAQDYGNMESIVVDGGSTDSTKQVVAKFGHVVSKYVSEKDRGIYDAMNKGVGMASGDYCIFLNAGDTFAASDVVKRAFEACPETPPDVVYGDVVAGVAGRPRLWGGAD